MAIGDIVITEGTPIVWADINDYDGGSAIGGARTQNIDLTDLLFTEARQGTKADLGASRAPEYSVTLAVEFKGGEVPEAGEVVDLYWGPAGNATSGVANQGGLSGIDSAYAGTAGGTLTESLKQLMYVGSISLTPDGVGTPQRDTWVLSPPTRYGQPVVVNSTDAEDFNDVDAEEMYIRMVPLTPNSVQS